MGGGYEFFAAKQTQTSADDSLARLGQAFAALKYDLLTLTPEEQAALKSADIELLPTWHALSAQAQVITQKVTDGTLAFVLFPATATNDPTEATMAALAKLATELRASKAYNLLIGLSTWGQAAEDLFITKHGQTFDIIFGAGDGLSFSGQYLQDDQLLWVRPSIKGKAINSIILPTLPVAGEKTTWIPDKSISTAVHSLNDSIASDQELVNILTP